MGNEHFWKTSACRQKVANKIYRSLLHLRTFYRNPLRESSRFESYLFQNATSKEEYFSGFVRLVLQIREELQKQGRRFVSKPDRIDALKGLDLPQGIAIPLLFNQGRVESVLSCTPYATPAHPQACTPFSMEENTDSESVLYRDLYMTPEYSVTGTPRPDNSSFINSELERIDEIDGIHFTDELSDDEDDGNFNAALANLSQEILPAEDENLRPQRIWVKSDLYSPNRVPTMPTPPTIETDTFPSEPLSEHNEIDIALNNNTELSVATLHNVTPHNVTAKSPSQPAVDTVNKASEQVESPVISVPSIRIECQIDGTYQLRRNKKRLAQRWKSYTAMQLKQIYFRKKLAIAEFELESLRVLHELDRKIIKKQMEKMLPK